MSAVKNAIADLINKLIIKKYETRYLVEHLKQQLDNELVENSATQFMYSTSSNSLLSGLRGKTNTVRWVMR